MKRIRGYSLKYGYINVVIKFYQSVFVVIIMLLNMVLKWIYINDKISNFKSSITINYRLSLTMNFRIWIFDQWYRIVECFHAKLCLKSSVNVSILSLTSQQNVKDDDVDIFRLIPYLYLYPDPIPYPFYFCNLHHEVVILYLFH